MTFSKEEYNLKSPESVPVIIKATVRNHLLTSTKVNIVSNDDGNESSTIEKSINENASEREKKEGIVTHISTSKIEFRFF